MYDKLLERIRAAESVEKIFETYKRLGEKKESLSPKQEEVLKKFELGKEYSAYNLKTSLGTLNALARKGYLTKKSGLGSMAFPSTSIMFKLKKPVASEVDNV